MNEARRIAIAAAIARWWALGSGVVVLALGLLFWSGQAMQLVPLHESVAATLLLALFSLGLIGAIVGVPAIRWVMAFIWVVLVPALGVAQVAIYAEVTNAMWIAAIHLIHMLLGLAAVGTAYGLSLAIERRMVARSQEANADQTAA